MDTTQQVKVASGLNIVAGVWLAASPWLLGFSELTTAMWTAVALGAVVAVLAAVRFSGGSPANSWINAIIGVAALVSPFVITGMHQTNAIVTGLVIAALGTWSASQGEVERHRSF